MAKAFDAYIAYRFVRLLTTPFEETEAYKHGIIDAEGNLLRQSDDLKTREERDSYTIFHRLVFNLKRLLSKFPLGKTTMASFASALFLIKESAESSYQIEKEFWNYLSSEFPELTKPENLHEQFTTSDTLRSGQYTVINEIIDGKGHIVEEGTEFTIESDQKAEDTVLGNPVFIVEVNNKKVPVSTQDIKKVQ